MKCWPQDGGSFITLPLVFTKNPKTGKRNVGMYRLQKYDSCTTGMHWHIHKNGADNCRDTKAMGGQRMEVAVAIGTDPVVTYAATAPLPRDIDEMVFAVGRDHLVTIPAITPWRIIIQFSILPVLPTARIQSMLLPL